MNACQSAVLVLAAGLGTRMKSALPKVMHRIAGEPMVNTVVKTAEALGPERVIVVIGDGMDAVSAAVAPHPTVVQAEPRLGTGHAVMAARPLLHDFVGDVLVCYGDTPLIEPATLERLLAARRASPDMAVAVLGFRPADPSAYGRLVLAADGTLERIVEAKDATPEELAVTLCNSGVMAIDGRLLFGLLDRISNENAKGEYYLTDIVAIARADGFRCAVVDGREDELIGINNREDLAAAEAILQAALRCKAMREGATLTHPESVFFSRDTRLGRDVVVGPFVVFGPGVTVDDGVEIRGFCHLEGVSIAAGAQIGPFARLRPGAVIGEDAHVGNFVEIKNAAIGRGAKVNHLSYIGDANIGTKVNVGAGTITCNYDGFFKDLTEVGAGAFIGSNTSLVAPVKVGAGAIIGAGSVVARDVPADALALTRGQHAEKQGWAAAFRERRGAEKALRQKQVKS
ncbi:MAG: bifunctional UDP-N-acetylglucosamine diphosphorylase/glucosamine-1-phosphate N-acetyltransferase GlmU [Rhodospirillales bacterium]